MKRPLLPLTVLYAAGVLCARYLPFVPIEMLLLSTGVAITAALWSRMRVVWLGFLLFLAGATNQVLRTDILSADDLRNILGDQPQIVTIRGTIVETPALRVFEQDEKEAWRTLAQIDVTALQPNRGQWRRALGRVAVSTPGALTNFFAGQLVEVTGVAALPRHAVAEGTFDYRAYLGNLEIYYALRASSEDDWQVIQSPRSRPLSDRFRNWGQRALAIGLPAQDESLRLEWALTLGWKTALTEEVSEPFVQAATYHIFAVDGLRMAILFGIFFSILRVARLPRALSGLLLIPLIWFYVALTGWPASAIRASVMLTIVICGWALRRPGDLLNSLFAAALVILIWQPQQLFQAGFQLSFFVVLCLILTVPPLHEWCKQLMAPEPLLPASLRPRWKQALARPTHWLADLFVTSFAAWIGSLPLVAYYFSIVTPVSTPANVLAVPLCALVLSSNLASLLCAAWFPAAAGLFNHAGWFLMECIRISSQWFADWPKAYFYVPAPSLFTSGLYYALLLAAVTGWLFRPHLRLAKITACSLLLALWSWQLWEEHLVTRLSILPANGAMAIYVDSPGNRDDMLIDCGTTNSVASATKEFLRAQGLNRLPSLVLTHGDLHHVGGAEMVAGLFNVRHVCVSPMRSRSPAYRRVLESFNRRPGLVQKLSCNDRLGPWTILHPALTDRFSRADDNALVLYASFSGTRVLLLSDLGGLGQEALLNRMPELRADIVVAGLPAASEALGDALLDAVKPKIVIIADSEFPASERASPKLRHRLARRRVPVIFTREAGSATLELCNGAWEVRTMEGTRVAQPPDQ